MRAKKGTTLSEYLSRGNWIFYEREGKVQDIVLNECKEIWVRPKLIAGSGQEQHVMEIICLNANGFPNTKNNIHKLKALEKTMEKADAMVILETGTNE